MSVKGSIEELNCGNAYVPDDNAIEDDLKQLVNQAPTDPSVTCDVGISKMPPEPKEGRITNQCYEWWASLLHIITMLSRVESETILNNDPSLLVVRIPNFSHPGPFGKTTICVSTRSAAGDKIVHTIYIVEFANGNVKIQRYTTNKGIEELSPKEINAIYLNLRGRKFHLSEDALRI